MIEKTVSGPFDVKMTPEAAPDAPVGAFALDKTYHGDLDATATGRMVSVGSPASGSAAYVAMERVTGTLAGHKGSFALMHQGTMAHGAQSLVITIAPDSGTEELKGITGTLDIRIEAGGKHFYTLRYKLPG